MCMNNVIQQTKSERDAACVKRARVRGVLIRHGRRGKGWEDEGRRCCGSNRRKRDGRRMGRMLVLLILSVLRDDGEIK